MNFDCLLKKKKKAKKQSPEKFQCISGWGIKAEI